MARKAVTKRKNIKFINCETESGMDSSDVQSAISILIQVLAHPTQAEDATQETKSSRESQSQKEVGNAPHHVWQTQK